MRLTIVGTGYVGLVTGTCFAESGNDVTCVDILADKIARLARGEVPIYEPGLEELVERNLSEGRLRFTTDLGEALIDRSLVFIAVGTPQGPNGAADLSALWSVIDDVRRKAAGETIVVVKSTVPVGTNAKVRERINEGGSIQHRVASNPEFLKQGSAVEDFMRPDRVIVGVRDSEAAEVLRELYAPYLRTGRPFLVMSPESAELTKYVANAILAAKISFINEMANLCERAGADINDVRQGIGHDARIGFQFLHPGVGFGGSCFPKDVRELAATAERLGVSAHVLHAIDRVNDNQKQVLYRKLVELLGSDLSRSTIAVWGLAFKPRTDDVREAPSLTLIHHLLESGARLRVHDPQALENVRRIFGDRLTYCARPYEALEGADALAIVTEWQEFRQPDWQLMRRLLRRLIIVDGRNLYDPQRMARLGFTYSSIGRRTVEPARHPT
jgi:UDPglucose 6-dehydrogenase